MQPPYVPLGHGEEVHVASGVRVGSGNAVGTSVGASVGVLVAVFGDGCVAVTGEDVAVFDGAEIGVFVATPVGAGVVVTGVPLSNGLVTVIGRGNGDVGCGVCAEPGASPMTDLSTITTSTC